MAEGAIPDFDTVPAQCGIGCRRHAVGNSLFGVIGWLCAALAAVCVSMIPYDFGESVCGVWGCYPPLQALVALHLLWCVAFGATIWAARRFITKNLLPLGLVLGAGAALGIGITLAEDLPKWTAHLPDELHRLWPRRVAYILATRTDVPLVEALVAGAVCTALGRRSRLLPRTRTTI